MREDGECVAECAPCAEHASCSYGLTPPACACAVGYARASADAAALLCSWDAEGKHGGGIVDPGLDDPAAWDTEGASFVADAFGMGDDGVVFDQATLCQDPYLSQVIQMPSRELAEPFVLTLEAVSRLSGTGGCQIDQLVQVGDSEQNLRFETSATQSARMCLGSAAYGPDVRVALIPEPRQCPTEYCISRLFGRMAIAPARAGECPEGPIVNANFDEPGGWQLIPAASSNARIVDGALNLRGDNDSGTASASQLVIIPGKAELSHAALRVRYQNYLSNGPMIVALDGIPLMGLWAATNTWLTRDYCIPREFVGSVRTLSFTVEPSVLADASVDSVSLISSASCASEVTGVTDPRRTFIRRASSAREIGWYSRIRLSTIRRLTSRVVVRVARWKFRVLILRIGLLCRSPNRWFGRGPVKFAHPPRAEAI